jgi:hypothetical protein
MGPTGLELTFGSTTITFSDVGSQTGSAITGVLTTQQFWIAGYGALSNISSVLYVGPTASLGLWAVDVGVVVTTAPVDFNVAFYSL